MDDVAFTRSELARELDLLLGSLRSVLDLPIDHPRHQAWLWWKRAVVNQVETLERRERHLSGGRDLWIELGPEHLDPAAFDNAEQRDTPIDHS